MFLEYKKEIGYFVWILGFLCPIFLALTLLKNPSNYDFIKGVVVFLLFYGSIYALMYELKFIEQDDIFF